MSVLAHIMCMRNPSSLFHVCHTVGDKSGGLGMWLRAYHIYIDTQTPHSIYMSIGLRVTCIPALVQLLFVECTGETGAKEYHNSSQ